MSRVLLLLTILLLMSLEGATRAADPGGGGTFPGIGGSGDEPGIGVVPKDPPDPDEPQETCTLELCCYPIDATLGAARHCFTKCTRVDVDGKTTLIGCWAGPTGLLGDRWPRRAPGATEPQCEDWTIFDGAWGPVATYCGPIEHDRHPDHKALKRDTTSCSTIGGDCDSCDCIKIVLDCIQECCLQYELFPELYGFNSNAAAYNSLLLCIDQPMMDLIEIPPGSPLLGEPGWGVLLPDDCDCHQ